MADLITIPTRLRAGSGELLTKHAAALDVLVPRTITCRDGNKTAIISEIDRHTRLLPLDKLEALRRELEALLRPASRDFVARAVAMITGSVPILPSMEMPDVFSRAMITRLTESEYPEWVLAAARPRAQDRFDIRDPVTIKGVREICEELIAPQRARLGIVDAMIAEYRRRAAAAERERAEAEAERRRAAERQVRWRAHYADAAPSADDFELAARACPTFIAGGQGATTLGMALDAGEPWAAALCPRLAIARRAELAHREHWITGQRAAAIARLTIAADETEARRQIEEVEAGRVRDLETGTAYGTMADIDSAIDAILAAAGCVRRGSPAARTAAAVVKPRGVARDPAAAAGELSAGWKLPGLEEFRRRIAGAAESPPPPQAST